MGVDVDEARREQAAGGIYRTAGTAADGADLGDDTVAHRDVCHERWAAGTIDNTAVLDDKIVHEPPSQPT